MKIVPLQVGAYGPPEGISANALHCATVSDGPNCHWKGGEFDRVKVKNRAALKAADEAATQANGESFNWMVKRVGQKAKLPFPVHAHMLRHSTGYKLAGDGHDTRSIQDYLGHRDIRHTVRYTELSPKPFRDFWRD